jgi:hypothetical protein
MSAPSRNNFVRTPAGDIQQQSVQRPAHERRVGLVRHGACVGVVVVVAVDQGAQQLLTTVHPTNLSSAATDSAGLPKHLAQALSEPLAGCGAGVAGVAGESPLIAEGETFALSCRAARRRW